MEQFDAVLVANGHYEEPYKPSLPGEGEWLAAPSRRPSLRTNPSVTDARERSSFSYLNHVKDEVEDQKLRC